MTRKEFTELYPGVVTAYHTKSWKTIVALEKSGILTLLEYCRVVIRDLDIARLRGVSINTIKDWKKRSDVNKMYACLKEEAIVLFAAEIESSSPSHENSKEML